MFMQNENTHRFIRVPSFICYNTNSPSLSCFLSIALFDWAPDTYMERKQTTHTYYNKIYVCL